MDLSALKTSLRLSRRIAFSAFLAGLLVACGSGDDPLQDWTCTESDVPADFEWRTGGNGNSDDIGQLGTGDVRTDGTTETFFSYWKQSVGNPPFDSPGELLCQVTSFEETDAAQSYLVGLSEDDGLGGLLTFAWLPDDYTVAERIFIAPVGARVFEIRVDGELRIIAAVQVVDRYVQSVLQGTSSGPPETDIAADIARDLRERTQLLVESENK